MAHRKPSWVYIWTFSKISKQFMIVHVMVKCLSRLFMAWGGGFKDLRSLMHWCMCAYGWKECSTCFHITLGVSSLEQPGFWPLFYDPWKHLANWFMDFYRVLQRVSSVGFKRGQCLLNSFCSLYRIHSQLEAQMLHCSMLLKPYVSQIMWLVLSLWEEMYKTTHFLISWVVWVPFSNL